jgi:transcriptional regulator with GAF, ATPase, and Fis domain
MKDLRLKALSSAGYGGLIEKIEIMRSRLRLSSRLERQEIRKLLVEINDLRSALMLLSRRERFIRAASTTPARESTTAGTGKSALIDGGFRFEGVLGESPRLLDALAIVKKAAPTDLPILVDGESGTGKELLAKVIHANGLRADKPFVSINCGAIPENLIESELFGHKKGSFTGAVSDRKGKFESANRGTIFLDEVGELPLSGQVKLLRVLQSQEIQRVGSDEPVAVDTRVVAATNRNLAEMSRQGRFREDLYYRLSVIHVTLPPLRDRRDEIPLLFDYFCDEAAEKLKRQPIKLTPRLRGFLHTYAYPGNIRELRNIVYRLSCLAEDTADMEHLPEANRPEMGNEMRANGDGELAQTSLGETKKAASDAAERWFLEKGLTESEGRVATLAKRIDMNRSHLQTLLKKHGLHSKDFRPKHPVNSPPRAERPSRSAE